MHLQCALNLCAGIHRRGWKPTGSTTFRSIVRRQVITVISGLCREQFPQWDHQGVDSVMCHIGNVIPPEIGDGMESRLSQVELVTLR